MSAPLKIYVAGPYTAVDRIGIESNVQAAIDVGVQLYLKGHYPYIPHLTDLVDLRVKASGIELTWEDYMKWDTVWLQLCDALYFIGESPGANMERAAALLLNLPVFYSLSAVPVVC